MDARVGAVSPSSPSFFFLFNNLKKKKKRRAARPATEWKGEFVEKQGKFVEFCGVAVDSFSSPIKDLGEK